ncbi:flavodoxin [Fusobacterium sp.]|uniref:flavodoxin n=1 Tax=Fusobacterium sp. TaxID=68766 RepID=UPI00260A6C0E|nr:flavodoxin [Fusobacterium sp.]
MRTGIFFGSTTGVTEDVCKKVAKLLDADVFEASEIDKVDDYDFLIFATSTWGMGDLQDSWLDAIDSLKNKNLSNKKVALIGVGDQMGFGDTFVNGMGTIYDVVSELGCNLVGRTSTDGYDHSDSTAVRDGEFVGLAIDENNQSDLTDERIAKWVESVK